MDLLGPANEILAVLCPEVRGEIKRPQQQLLIQQALDSGHFVSTALSSAPELASFVELHVEFGVGESAVLALAAHRGIAMASDDRKACNHAKDRLAIPSARIATTPRILLGAIQRGLISVQEADTFKSTLEGHRFRMNFSSFADLTHLR